MSYKNYVVISDNIGNEEYLRTEFHEYFTGNHYEIIDVDLSATNISRFILDEKLSEKKEIHSFDLDMMIQYCVEDYIDDIRMHLIEAVDELVYLNICDTNCKLIE